MFFKKIKTKTNAGTALENRLNLISPLQNVTGLDIKPKIFLKQNELEHGLKILETQQIKAVMNEMTKPTIPRPIVAPMDA
jgi:heptosyltransferase-2